MCFPMFPSSPVVNGFKSISITINIASDKSLLLFDRGQTELERHAVVGRKEKSLCLFIHPECRRNCCHCRPYYNAQRNADTRSYAMALYHAIPDINADFFTLLY